MVDEEEEWAVSEASSRRSYSDVVRDGSLSPVRAESPEIPRADGASSSHPQPARHIASVVTRPDPSRVAGGDDLRGRGGRRGPQPKRQCYRGPLPSLVVPPGVPAGFAGLCYNCAEPGHVAGMERRRELELRDAALRAVAGASATEQRLAPELAVDVEAARPACERGIIYRTPEVESVETALRWGLVAFVSGTRRTVSCAAASAAIVERFPELEGRFSVHGYWPADILLVFDSRANRDVLLTATANPFDGRDFTLRFGVWNRQFQATRRCFRFRVHLEVGLGAGLSVELPAPATKGVDTKAEGSAFDFFRQGSTTPSPGGHGSCSSSASIQSGNPKEWTVRDEALSPTGPLSPTCSVGSLDSWRTIDERFQGSPLSMFTVELTPAQVDMAVEVDEGKFVESVAAAEGLAAVPDAAPDPPGSKMVSVAASPVLDSSLAAASIASGSTDIHCSLAAFRERCRAKKAALLPRPLPRKTRKKRPPPSVVRRSARVAGRFAPGTLIKSQQRTLMIQLGIAREGEVISDEALHAYLRYFDEQPMMTDHLAACLALFGWHPDVLLVVDDDLVV
ncbi:hypothetical protein ACQ4PT_003398 [Festuca glaucescens]